MSATFELLLEMYQSGKTEEFVAFASKCLKEGVLSREESTSIVRLLPQIKFRSQAHMNQHACQMYLNLPGTNVETLCRDTRLDRQLITKALAGRSYSSKVVRRVLDAIHKMLENEPPKDRST